MKRNLITGTLMLIIFLGTSKTLQAYKVSLKDEKSKKQIKEDEKKKFTHYVDYDFLTGKISKKEDGLKPDKVNVGHHVVFRIKNINRMAYSIKIDSQDSTIASSDLSVLLQSENIQTTVSKAQEEKKDAILSIANNIGLSQPVLTNDLPLKTKTLANDANQLIRFMDNVTVFIEKSITEQKDSLIGSNDNEMILNEKKSISKIIDTLKEPFSEKNKDFDFLQEAYKNLAIEHLAIYTHWNHIQKYMVSYNLLLNTINNPLLNYKKLNDENKLNIFQHCYERLTDLNYKCSEMQQSIQKFNSNYAALIASAQRSNADLGAFNVLKITFRPNILNEEVKILKDQFEKIPLFKINTIVAHAYSYSKDPTTFEFVSSPIQPLQDMACFNVHIFQKDTANNIIIEERKFIHREFTRHGVRFDASIGLGVNLIGKNNLVQLNTTEDNQKEIARPNYVKIQPALMGFFTASYRSSSNWTGGLSIGFGLTSGDNTVGLNTFYIGPSIIAGRFNRVSFTAGLSLNNIYVLNNTYKVGDRVAANFTEANVATKAFVPGGFFSISYNLTKGVKDNVKLLKGIF